MLTAATRPMAPGPLTGIAARRRISAPAGAEVATTYPPIATKAICIVKVIRLQNPSPNAWLTARGEAPLPRAARATTTTAMATNTKASGNQRSAQAVKPMAMRTSSPSWVVVGLVEGFVTAVVMKQFLPNRSFAIALRLQLHFRNSTGQFQFCLGRRNHLLDRDVRSGFHQGGASVRESDHRHLGHHQIDRPD